MQAPSHLPLAASLEELLCPPGVPSKARPAMASSAPPGLHSVCVGACLLCLMRPLSLSAASPPTCYLSTLGTQEQEAPLAGPCPLARHGRWCPRKCLLWVLAVSCGLGVTVGQDGGLWSCPLGSCPCPVARGHLEHPGLGRAWRGCAGTGRRTPLLLECPSSGPWRWAQCCPHLCGAEGVAGADGTQPQGQQGPSSRDPISVGS